MASEARDQCGQALSWTRDDIPGEESDNIFDYRRKYSSRMRSVQGIRLGGNEPF